jgi:hypothetical protein
VKTHASVIAAGMLAAGQILCPAARAESPSAAGNQQMGGGFERFIPNQAGEIAWVLKGTMARFLSAQMVEIGGLFAQSYEPQAGDLKIQVDQVIFNTRTNEVVAKGERVNVRRENMVLTGRGIAWDPRQKTIRVMEDVRVLIKEQGNGGLFPQ